MGLCLYIQGNVLFGEPAQVEVKQKSASSKIAQLRDQPKEKTIYL